MLNTTKIGVSAETGQTPAGTSARMKRGRVFNESAVRDALRMEVLAGDPEKLCLLDEFWIPLSHERADLVVIDDHLRAFEIKTQKDSLKRLPRQASAYARVFDECVAVLHERHVAGAEEILPAWWGIWMLTENTTSFIRIRPSGTNPSRDVETLVRLLWRNEAELAVQQLGLPIGPGASRSELWRAILSTVDASKLESLVCRFIGCRDVSQSRIATRQAKTRLSTT